MELVDFLRARLDEDEQVARGTTTPLDWHQGPGDDDPEWVGDEMVLMWPPEFHTPYEQDKHWRGLTADPAGLAAHIVRHDPARVLAEVEAKRRILDKVVPQMNDMTDQIHAEFGVGPMDPSTYESLDLLRLLALPYADHEAYRQEWKP